jgi:hypothetical protein
MLGVEAADIADPLAAEGDGIPVGSGVLAPTPLGDWLLM